MKQQTYFKGFANVPGIRVMPEGGTVHGVSTPDGVWLRAASWRGAATRGTVLIVNGRGDYIERYFETVDDLQARGFAVACFDFRGQGGSERSHSNPYRSSISSFSRYEDDLAAVMTSVVLPDLPPPYYLLGHSTGGLIGLSVLRRRNWFDKAVFTSPLLGVHPGPWPMPVARSLAHVVPWLGGGSAFLPGYSGKPIVLQGFEGNPLTLDKKRFERDVKVLQAQPSLGLGGPSFSWLRAAFRQMDDLQCMRPTQRLMAPALIIAAGQDKVVNTRAARNFADRVAGVSYVEIRDAFHEILMERDEIREQFFAAFDAFVGV